MKKTYFEPGLQRRVVWEEKLNMVPYISAVIERKIRTAIIVADLNKCLNHAKEIGCDSSIKYFTNLLKRGYQYLSIDGQNRSQAIVKFMDGGYPIQGCTYTNASGMVQPILTNTHYSKLKGALRWYLDDGNCVLLDIIEDMTVAQLHEVYLSTNSGVQHSRMEVLNAEMTHFANRSLKIATANEDMFSKRLKGIKYSRMDDLFYTAQATIIAQNKDNHASIDDVEEYYTGKKEVTKKTFNRVEKVFEKIANILDVHYGESKKGNTALYNWWALYFTINKLYDMYGDNFDIASETEFFTSVVGAMKHLREEADLKFSEATTAWHKNNKIDSPPKKSDYFSWKSGNIKRSQDRNDVIAILLEHLSGLYDEGKKENFFVNGPITVFEQELDKIA